MQINGPGPIDGVSRVDATHATQATQDSAPTSGVTGSDEVTISQEAQLLSRIHDLPDVRQDVVDRVRAEIAGGTYETPDKIDVAVSRLLDEIA